MSQTQFTKPSLESVVPVLALLGMGNVFFVPLANAGHLGGFLFVAWAGVIAAQIALLSAWIVLAPNSLAFRVLVGCAVGLLLFGLVILGVLAASAGSELGGQEEFRQFIVNVVCSMPLISLAAQTPFWFIRIILRWRLVAGAAKADVSPDRPLALRDMFVATAAVSVVFALLKLVNIPSLDSSTYVVQLLLAAGVVTIICATTTLPLALVILRSKDPATGYALFGFLLLIGVTISSGVAGVRSMHAFLYVLIVLLAYLGSQSGALAVARQHGVELVGSERRDIELRDDESNEPKASLPDSDA